MFAVFTLARNSGFSLVEEKRLGEEKAALVNPPSNPIFQFVKPCTSAVD
jgi:hypothetical protein